MLGFDDKVMRKAFVKWLRKTADYLDPAVMPQNRSELVIKVSVDSSEAIKELDRIAARADKIRRECCAVGKG